MRWILIALVSLTAQVLAARDPLSSWHEGPAKQAILSFCERVTRPGANFVPPAARIAVFDNDGTLWSEQPNYVQATFALDRAGIRGPAPTSEREIVDLIASTHAGMATTEFQTIVKDWFAKARHPRFQRPYTDLVYQPMLEVLTYLRANGFKTYIVSGGGVEFMRAFAEQAYGIPPEQVIGSMIKLKYEHRDGIPVLLRLPSIEFVDDGPGKPVGIQRVIGRRPILAVGNSDGDFEMLDWTTAPNGQRLGLIIHHTDGDREWAYDRQSKIGRLDRALTAASKHNWVVVDMKKNWKIIYPFSGVKQ